jgi:cardiolipin synthase
MQNRRPVGVELRVQAGRRGCRGLLSTVQAALDCAALRVQDLSCTIFSKTVDRVLALLAGGSRLERSRNQSGSGLGGMPARRCTRPELRMQPPSIMNDSTSSRPNPLRTAPNLLTLLRICMAPFLVAAILGDHYALGFGLFVAAGLTDALDGLLARILSQRSMLGHYLDPVADKLLLSTIFLVLLHKGLMPTTVTVLVFGRDVGILLVAAILYAAVGRREFRPSIFGKANTLAQIGAVAAVLLHQLTVARWVAAVRTAALDATVALTIASGLHYAWMASRRSAAPAANGISSRPEGSDSGHGSDCGPAA